MGRLLSALVLVLAGSVVEAQSFIRYHSPGVAAGGTFTAPLFGPAANNCTAGSVPYSFSGDNDTGVCSSAANTVGFITGGTTRLSTSTTAVTSTVPVYLPDGTVSAPALTFAGQTDTGIFRPSGQIIDFTTGNATFRIQSNGVVIPTASFFAWGAIGGAADLFFYREAAANLQFGADAATATAQTISAADSTGAGVAGASLTLSGGVGGTFGAQGNVIADASSTFVSRNTSISLTSDAAIQYGCTVMPDAGTDGRFDVTTASATLSIGVLGGVGAAAQGTAYPVITSGLAYVAQAEDQTITRGHYLLQSGTAGYVDDSATVSTDGLNIALSLYSEPVTYNINPTGCTGGSGCINTALNTPNAGPAGQITLDTDVAAAGWAVGQPVIYWNSGGTSPTGLTDGGVYFIASVSTTNVTIAATYGGAVVVPSSQGDDGTQYLARLPLAVVDIR